MVNSGRRRNGSQLTKTVAKYEAKTLNVVCVLSRGHVVNEEYSVKLLGSIVDQKLSLGVHVRDAVKRLSIGRVLTME